jgi:hypothetical protein
MVRPPAVAGQFYSASPDVLDAEIARYSDPTTIPQPCLAVVSPHAGLMYSGHVAGATYSRVSFPPSVILIGPNHFGVGVDISVYPEGAWQIPGGAVSIDRELAAEILTRFPRAKSDTGAHRTEHSLEVQLPFLRRARPDVRIVPILLGMIHPGVDRDLGICLATLIQEYSAGLRQGPPPLLVASTDMSHYESDAVTRAKDRFALEAIESLQPERLDAAVQTHGITMCGHRPTTTVLHACRALGATCASLVRYATSGDITGDRSRVVGYAGFAIR